MASDRSDGVSGLRRVAADVWETSRDDPFPGLTTHGYVWTGSPVGNVLLYSVATDRDLDAIDAIGGLARQYLSHRDEAGPMLDVLAGRFGLSLHAPATEADEIGRHRRPDVLLATAGTDDAAVEVVPTPGHSPGSTCFVVEGAGGRYLFTGDTVYRTAEGPWAAGHIPGISDADALVVSLDRLAGIEPDLVLSSAFAGEAGVHAMEPGEWRRHVDEARRGLVASVR